VEALAALLIRVGRPQEAERRMNAAIASAPARARPYSFLAQALRAQGKLDGALAALHAGVVASGPDPALSIERGMVLAAVGDLAGAASAWREALDRDPMNPAAFGRLAALALRARDATVGQVLVDSALAMANAPVDVLRSAIRLAVGTEPDGLPRAARLLKLGERVLEKAPNDAGALVLMARSQLVLGDKEAARLRKSAIELAPGASPLDLELAEVLLALDDPEGAVARTQSAMALDGPTAEALLLLGHALGESGRTSEAMEAAQAGLAMQPEDARFQELVRTLKSPRQRRAWLRGLGRRMRSWVAF
jgi:tetratricopeptide (TPR) repeat protein